MATPDFTGLDPSQIPPDLIPPRRPGPVPVLTNDNFPQDLLPAAANDADGGSQDPTTSLILKTLLPQIQQQAQQEAGNQWEQRHAQDYGAGLALNLPPAQKAAFLQNQQDTDPKAIAQDNLLRAQTARRTGDDATGEGLLGAMGMSKMADLVPQQAQGPQGGGTATAALKDLLPFVQKPMTPYEQAQVALQGREQNLKEKQFNELSANQAGTLAQRSASDTARLQQSDTRFQAQQRLREMSQQLQQQKMAMPTAAMRTRAEQAGIVISQAQSLIDEIEQNRDALGAVAGRIGNLEQGIGSNDPRVSALFTHLKSFAALQPALHGSRGVGMQQEFEQAIGGLAQNPDALMASVESLAETAKDFQSAGGEQAPMQQQPGAPAAQSQQSTLSPGGGTVKMRAPDGTIKDVPADQVQHYKSRGATVAQ